MAEHQFFAAKVAATAGISLGRPLTGRWIGLSPKSKEGGEATTILWIEEIK